MPDAVSAAPEEWDVVVIGSGAGGLTAATALANLGKKVLILEQHYLPGGWTHTFALDGHKFSPGVHYIGQLGEGGSTREILEGLGLAADLEFNELNPDGYDHIVFENETFDIPRGRENFRQRLIERFPRERDGINSYFAHMMSVDRGLKLATNTRSLWGKLKLLLLAPALALTGLKPAGQIIDRYVRDPRLKAILESRAGDHGMAPERVPFALHVAIDAHYWEGAWYPKGGGGALSRAMLGRLKKTGGEIRLRTRVQRILVEGHGAARRAVGVRLESGKEIRAQAVLSNADAWITYQKLLTRVDVSERLRKRVSELEPSCSALSLFLATDIDVDALGLDSGNYWIINDGTVDPAYQLAASGHLDSDEPFPCAFLTVTTRKDPDKQRDGLHTMEAFAFVPYACFEEWKNSNMGNRPEPYEALKKRLTERMLDSIERVVPTIRQHLVLCELGTPLTNEFYVESHLGNIYGPAKSKSQIGPGALPIRTEIPGLFHCGQSTSAHGVLGVMMTGITAACQISGQSRNQILAFGKDQNVKLNSLPAVMSADKSVRAADESQVTAR